MLDDDISHVVPVGVAILVQAVHGAKDELIEGYGAVITGYGLGKTTDKM